ncbi:MAG: hypothetical protein IKR25_05490 [Muribaculaceae bacterium]|nr:hypothetical protein [Muribaculaceae bacterium]
MRHNGSYSSVSYTLSGVPVLGVVSSIGGRHRHTGKPWHNLGGLAWYDNRARWYDPVTMRFLAPDPLADQDHVINIMVHKE